MRRMNHRHSVNVDVIFLRGPETSKQTNKTMLTHTSTHDSDARIISRFSTAILSCTLFGMTVGHALPKEMMQFTITAALISTFYFFYKGIQETRSQRRQQERSKQVVEMRLQDHTLEYRPGQSPLLEEAS